MYYVYLLEDTNKSLECKYIGCRKCPDGILPADDKYLGSSTNKEFNPNKKTILYTFLERYEALAYETFLQKKFNVLKDPQYVNRVIYDGGRFFISQHTEETKQKIRKAHLGKTLSIEHREKLKIAHTGKKLSEKQIADLKKRRHRPETKQKMSKASIGKKKSDTHKANISISKTGDKNPRFGKSKLHSFVNLQTGVIEENISIKEMCIKYPELTACSLSNLTTNKINKYKNFSMAISSQDQDKKPK
jgi:hypothetical protein